MDDVVNDEWKIMCEMMISQCESDLDILSKQSKIQKKWQYYAPKVISSKCPGDIILKNLRNNLRFFDLNGIVRSKQQRKFHEAFIGSCIRNIYRDDFHSNYMRILDENPGFDNEIRQEVLVCCPRRFGKTFAVGMFVSAYLMSVPNCKVCVFSPGRRQSVMMLDLIRDFVLKFPHGKTRIETKNQEKMILKGDDGADKRTVWAYPSKVETLKGVGGDLIILEEMAVIDMGVFYEVVVPLLELDNTAMIGISTIKGEDNFLTKFLKMKDDSGKPFFKSYMFYLACETCRNAGLASSCTHLMNELPAWQSQRKHKRIRAMMEDQKELLEQETIGISHSSNERAFSTKSINSLFDRPSIVTPGSIDFIFISIDPNGGGASDFALTSTYFFRGNYYIIGGETVPSKDIEKNFDTLHNHYDLMNQNKIFKNSTKIFIIENNLGFEAQHYAKYINNNFKNLIVLKEQDSIGFHTDHKFKAASCEKLRALLQTNMISFSTDFFTASSSVEKIKEKYMDQLQNYVIVKDVPKSHFSKIRKTYTGKTSVGAKDDLCITLQLNIYWSWYFMTEKKYSRFRE